MCLLKKTKFGKFAFCKDDFGLDRYSSHKVMECLREHNVNHCTKCVFCPDRIKEVS